MSENRSFIKLDFEIENETGGYDLVPVTIRKMRFEAFDDLLNILYTIYEQIESNPNLKVLFMEMFTHVDDFDPEAVKNFTEAELQELKRVRQRESEQRFFQGIAGAIPLLLVHLPKQAKELVYVVTGVDRDLLGQQDFDTVLDVYDAMLEVNNVEKLYNRIKKSSNVTKKAVGFLNLRRKATKA